MTCCYYHMAVTTDDGELWTCVAGTHGQLGHADRAHQLAGAQTRRGNSRITQAFAHIQHPRSRTCLKTLAGLRLPRGPRQHDSAQAQGDGRRWVPGVGRSRVGVSCTRLAVPGGLVTHRVRAPPGQPERPGPVGNRLRPAGNMWPGKKHVDQAFACEGADENSWQSRPQGDCSRPSSRHVTAGREHDSKKCRTPSSLCSEPSR